MLHKNYAMVAEYLNMTVSESELAGQLAQVSHADRRFIHPAYMYMQQYSPLYAPDYKLPLVDVIGPHEFYRNFLAKALPLHFKGYAKDWEITKKIAEFQKDARLGR